MISIFNTGRFLSVTEETTVDRRVVTERSELSKTCLLSINVKHDPGYLMHRPGHDSRTTVDLEREGTDVVVSRGTRSRDESLRKEWVLSYSVVVLWGYMCLGVNTP